jgi:hypothetical protein
MGWNETVSKVYNLINCDCCQPDFFERFDDQCFTVNGYHWTLETILAVK